MRQSCQKALQKLGDANEICKKDANGMCEMTTGLFDFLEKHIINNLVDYATGVETGLDSNDRKNHGGHLMENLVESFIRKAGFVKDENYFKEMYIHQITEK